MFVFGSIRCSESTLGVSVGFVLGLPGRPRRAEDQPGASATASDQHADGDEEERLAVADDDDVAQAERLPGRVDELAAARVAVVGVLRHRVAEDGVDLDRQVGVARSAGRRLLQVRPEDGQLGARRRRRLARQALVEHAAERVHVGAAVHVAALDLLRRRVGGRADARARRFRRCRARRGAC